MGSATRLPCSVPSSDGGVAVGHESGDGLVGVRKVLSAVGPARQLFPAFVVGESVFDGDPLRGVLVPLAFVVLEEGECRAWS